MNRPRITIGRMMVVVAMVALVSAIALEVPPTLNPLMAERGYRLGAMSYCVVVALITGVASMPWILGITLSLKAFAIKRSQSHFPVRRLLIALTLLSLGLAILYRPLPLDGLREAHRLKSGTYVMVFDQYRLWPGRHVTLNLEVMGPDGRSKIYPISNKTRPFEVDLRINANQTMVWLVEMTRHPRRPISVLCSMDLKSGRFIGPPGPFPAQVSQSNGLPAP